MIAANLVIDGILTTWIASARDSLDRAGSPSAPRKILQEEGAHKVHAEAWCQAHLPPWARGPRCCARADR
jgi:ring-1,2-phenylacetyl-CoA epoxidase subunit PaaA/ring-1,2-phenylacetyl-CoA epoxidase subunit PaaC